MGKKIKQIGHCLSNSLNLGNRSRNLIHNNLVSAQIDGVSFFLSPKLGSQGLFVNNKFIRNITKREKSLAMWKGKKLTKTNF